MKRLVLLLFFFTEIALAQSFKFAWFTDTHIGTKGAEEDLTEAVNQVNSRKDISFTIVSGDITEKGLNDELERAKGILDKLKKTYYIIPGNHDTKWSPSGGVKFTDLWGDERFAFEHKGVKFIGLNSGIMHRGGGGHFSPEDLYFLEEQLSYSSKEQEIIIVFHHPLLHDIDNWFEFANRVKNHNIIAILVGHGHANKKMDFHGIPGIMARSTLKRDAQPGFVVVEAAKDSIFFFESTGGKTSKEPYASICRTSRIDIEPIDTLQFIPYNCEALWQTDLKSSTLSRAISYNGGILACIRDGVVSHFDAEGTLIWETDIFGTVTGTPVVFDTLLALGTIEGDLNVIDLKNGEIVQTFGLGEALTSRLIAIEFKGERKFLKDSVFSNIGIIAGTSAGKLLCIDPYLMQILWENKDAKGMIESAPIFIEDKIVYGAWDGYLYCADAKNGKTVWKWSENKNFYYSPAACDPLSDGKNLYISTPDKFVSSIESVLGKTNWRNSSAVSWETLGISNDNTSLFIKSYQDKFYIISSAEGSVINEYDLKYGLDTSPTNILETEYGILFGAKNGIVYLIDGDSSFKKVLFLGSSRILNVIQLNQNVFCAINMDGKVCIFKIK